MTCQCTEFKIDDRLVEDSRTSLRTQLDTMAPPDSIRPSIYLQNTNELRVAMNQFKKVAEPMLMAIYYR